MKSVDTATRALGVALAAAINCETSRPARGRRGLLQRYAQSQADIHIALDNEVEKKETAWAKESHEAVVALRPFDDVSSTARAVAAGFVVGLVPPDTRKSQPTDTDKVNAVEKLLNAGSERPDEAWAKALLAGPFGRRDAPLVNPEPVPAAPAAPAPAAPAPAQ